MPFRIFENIIDLFHGGVESFSEPVPRPKDRVDMPDLIGLTFRKASDECQRLELQLDFRAMEPVEVAVEGTVTFQEPEPGTLITTERKVMVYMTYPAAARRRRRGPQ
ncbi:MAG: PASTA domain-containing protein [Actinomycetota bacterium]|nr:PASTA domain-containing protein [Actinomycetota bacterium]